jgi:hypothetical protein
MEPLTHYTIGIIYRQQEEPEPFAHEPSESLFRRLLTLIRRKVEAVPPDHQPNIPLIECYGEQE